MSTRVETVPASIEHLDFAPPCEANDWKGRGCRGSNAATYAAIFCRRPCRCASSILICTQCVQWRVASGVTDWHCVRCGDRSFGRWLDVVTLHPLGGTP